MVLLFAPSICFAFGQGNYVFSISPLIGVLYGQGEEIVYNNSSTNAYKSELLWDLKPLMYAGFNAGINPGDFFTNRGFNFALFFKYGIPIKTGAMEDRDWLNPQENFLTRYSRHDAFSQSTFFADLSAGYSWPFGNSLALKTFLEFSFSRLSWSGENGYYQYSPGDSSPWTSSLPKKYFRNDFSEYDGRDIMYSQNWLILAPGVSMSYKPSQLLVLEAIVNYSPLIYCAAKDEHVLRNATFNDRLYGGHYIKGTGLVSFLPKDKMEMILHLSYKLITGSRGDTTVGSIRENGTAGGGYSAVDFGLIARFFL